MEKFKPSETLMTERLMLRKRSHGDDTAIWETVNDNRDFLREYLFWVDGTTSFSDVYAATDMFARFWDDDTEWCYDIFCRSDNRLIGCIGAHRINFMNQSAELGYWLSRSATGNGYMTEAVEALEKELFEKGLHRLAILCDEHNHASAAVAKRAGYDLESIAKEALYHYTGLHDCLVFAKISPYPIMGF